MPRRPTSQIPPSGIDKGTWDYIREPAIAAGYDAGLAGDPLTTQDTELVAAWLRDWRGEQPPVVADFGCGTGRSLLPILPQGCPILAIDLSLPMLGELQQKLTAFPPEARQNLLAIQANLLQLGGLASESVDLGLCLYSTFGMLRGRENRDLFLSEAWRILKPGGTLLLHGHHLWWQLNFPGGLRWLSLNRLRSWFDRRLEFGDRFADQRTIRQLPIHSFTLGSLKREMQAGGFETVSVHPVLDPGGYRSRLVRLFGIRAQGWTLMLRRV